MKRALVIKQTNTTFAALEQQAVTGLSPSQAAAEARERFERRFGSVDLGLATGADNESIDADLAREYAAKHDQD